MRDKLVNAQSSIKWVLVLFGVAVVAAIALPAALSSAVSARSVSDSTATNYMFIFLGIAGLIFVLLQLFMAWAAFKGGSATAPENGGRTLVLTVLGLLPTISAFVLLYLWFETRKQLKALE